MDTISYHNEIKNHVLRDENDEWGFYIDLEEELSIPHSESKKLVDKKYDDHYDYNEYYQYKVTNMLIKVSSTTLITIGLTYLVFCLL
jgi:hypothetical protein